MRVNLHSWLTVLQDGPEPAEHMKQPLYEVDVKTFFVSEVGDL